MIRTTAIVLFAAAAATTPPPTAREMYNEGLKKLEGKELREAEKSFLDAAKTNHEEVQPLATYNLGHTRFLQGKETLSGEKNRQQLLDSNAAATAIAEEALRKGNEALLGDQDVRTLVERYNEARTARRALRVPKTETTRALELLGSVISRWRTSANSFHSAFELAPENKDASFNADVVERHLREQQNHEKKLQEQQEAILQQRKDLREVMKKLWAQIPPEFRQPPEEGEGEEDEDDDAEEDQEQRQSQGGEKEEEDKEGGKKEEKEKRNKGSAGQQKQRLGGDREIDPDMLKMLKEKIKPRTMSPGNEPEGSGDRRSEFANPFEQDTMRGEPRRRRPRDW
jgi:hypothetical protein